MKQQNLQGEALPVHVLATADHRLTPEEQLLVKRQNVAVKHPSEQWGHWVIKCKVAFDLLSQGKSFLMEARLTGLPADDAGHFATGQYDMFCPEERVVYEVCDGDLTPEKVRDRAKYGFPVVYVEWLSGYALRVAAQHKGVPVWLAYHAFHGRGRSRAPLELLKSPIEDLRSMWRDLLARRLGPALKDEDTLLRKHTVKPTIAEEMAADKSGEKVVGRKTMKFYSSDLVMTDPRWSPLYRALGAYEVPQILRAFHFLGKLNVYDGGNKGLCLVLTERGLADLQTAAAAKHFEDLTAGDFAGEEE